MPRNQKWVWLLLCIALLLLVSALGTSWNLVIVSNYEKMLQLAQARWGQRLPEEWRNYPWWTISLGTLGFLSILTLSIVVTWKLLVEMRANQAQSEFLAMISHELKSPLATLELSSDLLESEVPQSDSSKKLWRAHRSELQRLKVEIERLLTASRWDSFRDRPKLEPIDLASWIQSRESKWAAILGEGARLLVHLPKEKLWVLANSDYLDLIANNFVDNARKFTLGTAPELAVSLEVKEAHGRIQWSLSFKDKGSGFEKKLQKKIFKRFFRGPQERRSAGSGLGLYLAKRAASAMRFKISAESAGTGQGSAFRLQGDLNV